MYNVIVAGLIFLSSLNFIYAAERTMLDEILAVLPHPGGDLLILASDMQTSFDGAVRTFREVVLDGLMVLKARDMGVIPSASVVDSMILSIQKRYNLTHDQLIELFEAQGFSFEEGKELLKRRRMIDEILGYMVRVDEPSKDEIARYHLAHVETEEATYTIRLGFISSEHVISKPGEQLLSPAATEHVAWDEEMTYAESDLGKPQKFVCDLKPGDIYVMSQTDDGYDVVQLVAKVAEQILPADEAQISMKLRQQVFSVELKKFHETLLQHAKIRFCGRDDLREELLKEIKA